MKVRGVTALVIVVLTVYLLESDGLVVKRFHHMRRKNAPVIYVTASPIIVEVTRRMRVPPKVQTVKVTPHPKVHHAKHTTTREEEPKTHGETDHTTEEHPAEHSETTTENCMKKEWEQGKENWKNSESKGMDPKAQWEAGKEDWQKSKEAAHGCKGGKMPEGWKNKWDEEKAKFGG